MRSYAPHGYSTVQSQASQGVGNLICFLCLLVVDMMSVRLAVVCRGTQQKRTRNLTGRMGFGKWDAAC